jgi:hypothetical protein
MEGKRKSRRRIIKEAAVVFGLLVAGTLKWVLESAQSNKTETERAPLAVDAVTSLIGTVGHDSEIVGGFVGLVASHARSFLVRSKFGIAYTGAGVCDRLCILATCPRLETIEEIGSESRRIESS